MVDSFPSTFVEADAGMEVLGNGFDGKSLDLVNGGAPKDGRCAGEKGGIPVVHPGHNKAIKHIAFVPFDMCGLVKSERKGINVIVILWGPDERNMGVRQIAQCLVEKVWLGHVVRIEDGNKIPPGNREGVIEVAGLGVDAFGSCQVFAS